jgi:hypothetical protein
MTPHEIALANALGSCTYLPGTSHKRFARDMSFLAAHSPERELTLRQRHYMECMAWRYRRQMPTALVPETRPLDLPKVVKERKAKKAKLASIDTIATQEALL